MTKILTLKHIKPKITKGYLSSIIIFMLNINKRALTELTKCFLYFAEDLQMCVHLSLPIASPNRLPLATVIGHAAGRRLRLFCLHGAAFWV